MKEQIASNALYPIWQLDHSLPCLFLREADPLLNILWALLIVDYSTIKSISVLYFRRRFQKHSGRHCLITLSIQHLLDPAHPLMAAKNRNLSCSRFQMQRLLFNHITRDLEVSSPALVPLMRNVGGQRPGCLHSSLFNVLVFFVLVIRGRGMRAATWSRQEEVGRVKGCMVPITPSSPDGNLDGLWWSPTTLMAQFVGLLLLLFSICFTFHVLIFALSAVWFVSDVSSGSSFIYIRGGSFPSTNF